MRREFTRCKGKLKRVLLEFRAKLCNLEDAVWARCQRRVKKKLGDEVAIHSVGTIGIKRTSFDMDYPVR